MSKSPKKTNNQPQPKPTPDKKFRALKWGAVGLGISLTGGIVAGGFYGWHFVNNSLAPLVERELTQTLKRPVQLGRVENITWNGLGFGPSAVPATIVDPDRATVESVDVKFNLLNLIFTRNLVLDITLKNPNLYLEQDNKGLWIEIPQMKEEDDSGTFIKTEVDTLRVVNAAVALLPTYVPQKDIIGLTPQQQQTTIKFFNVNGKLQLRENNKVYLYQAQGKPASGGSFSLQGETRLSNKSTHINVKTNDFSALDLHRLGAKTIELPIALGRGKIESSLDVRLLPNQEADLRGYAKVQSVLAKIEPLPQLLSETNGEIEFLGDNFNLKNIKTIYGQVPALAQGLVSLKNDSNLQIVVPPVAVANALEAIDVKIPFTTAGNVQLDILVKGPITNPVVTGNARTPDQIVSENPPLTIDRIDLAKFKADFIFSQGIVDLKNIEALPQAGGKITALGTIKVGADDRPPSLSFSFNAADLPGDKLALIYGVSPQVKVGNVSANGEIVGPADNIQTTVKWQAPEAIFPIAGKAIILGDTVLLQDTLATVAGGTASISGQLIGKQWQARIEPLGIKLSQLAQVVNRDFITEPEQKIANTNIPGQIISGRINLAGNIDAVSPENIAVESNLLVGLGSGAANVKAAINGGNLQAMVEPVGLELAEMVALAESFSPSPLPISAPEVARLPVQFLGGDVTLSGPVQNLSLATLSASTQLRLNVAGGDTAVTGTLKQGVWKAAVEGTSIDVSQFAQLPIPTGPATVQATLSGNTDNLTPEGVQVRGGAALAVSDGYVTVEDIRLAGGRWAAQVGVNNVAVAPLLPPDTALVSSQLGRFTGDFQVSGSTQAVNVNNIQVNGSGSLAVADGRANVQVQTGTGQILATVDAVDVPVQPFLPPGNATLSANLGRFNGNFDVAINQSLGETINPASIAVNGAGRLGVGTGVADVNIATTGTRWQATIAAADLPLAPLLPPSPLAEEIGNLTGNFTLAGNTTNLELAAIQGSGKGVVGLAGGTLNARNIQLRAGRWQAQLEPNDIQLSRINPQLRGKFDGNLEVAGSVSNPSLETIVATGNVRFSQGIAILNDPLSAVIAWDGSRLNIKQATSAQLTASGFINIDTQNLGTQPVRNFDLTVNAKKLDLTEIAQYGINLTNNQNLSPTLIAGKADFDGNVSGTLSKTQVVGNLQVTNLVVNQIAFEPVLSGSLNVITGQKIDLDLRGKQDQIAFNLDSNYLPTRFTIQSGEVLASGVRTGNQLKLNLQQFPLAGLKLPSPEMAGPGYLEGTISANLNLNLGNALSCKTLECVLPNLQGGGQVAIANPRLGYLKADNFSGDITIAQGIARLKGGSLRQGSSEYLISGQTTLGVNPQYQASVQIKQGQLQQILTSLQIFRLEDFQRGIKPPQYSSGEAVRPEPVSVANLDLLTQLRRYAEIQALLAQQKTARENASPLPDLADLQGEFKGEISVKGSLAAGVEGANFKLEGQNWNWGRYTVDRAQVQGSYQNGVVTLLPLRLERGDGVFAFSGTVGTQKQSGQLLVENFPIEPLQELAQKMGAQLPVSLTGKLNAKATIGGSIFNPQAVGEVTLVSGSINQTAVQSARASFALSDLRLNFGATATVTGPEPIQAVGSLPLLPLPGRDNISLALNVQNEALAVLNVISNQQLQWVSGKGQVQVRVEGTLQEPLVTGVAVLEDAVVQAQLLPEPLTNVTGRLLFNRDRVNVEGIKGRFGNGEVVAQGVLPIFAPLSAEDQDRGNPLRVSLDRLAVNLKGLYRGGVTGLVGIGGTAFKPRIGGRIELFDGQVLLADAVMAARQNQAATEGTTPEENQQFDVGFNNLQLVLGNNIGISQVPLFNFAATGNLRINGLLDDLKPAGTIRLTRGEVNLFTTQFRLAGGYEQTATFLPNRGLDPLLNVRLVASVSEVVGSQLPATAFSNEIADNPVTAFGSTQTVRIQARVEGPASRLVDSLELTSSPSRSTAEIVALLGGGFANTLGRGDSTLALANLAGTALLSPLESLFRNALGLAEFRLFPTIINDGNKASTLGLAAEAGIDITQSLSASVLQILTDQQPAQWGVRYRLNDKTLLRGSTNFSGDSRATIEYEIRF